MNQAAVREDRTDRISYYANILNPIFNTSIFNTTDSLFEIVCTLVRASGIQDAGWDPWGESREAMDDLFNLAMLELPPEKFPRAERTNLRLALLSYCHVTEMDFPYVLVANLLNLPTGKKYKMNPFDHLTRPQKKKGGLFPKLMPPSPGRKILFIKELAKEAKLPLVGQAFEEIYDNDVRNAVYHSDYTLTDKEFRIRSGTRLSRTKKHFTPVVPLDELSDIISNAFAFYSALFALYDRCLKSFGDFIDAFLPYDFHYKGVLQLLFDTDNSLIGFRVYWPNGTIGEYKRTKQGCSGINFQFDPDGSVNFFVGLYPAKHGNFSLLVEEGAKPHYVNVPGANVAPHWPGDLKPYKLNLN